MSEVETKSELKQAAGAEPQDMPELSLCGESVIRCYRERVCNRYYGGREYVVLRIQTYGANDITLEECPSDILVAGLMLPGPGGFERAVAKIVEAARELDPDAGFDHELEVQDEPTRHFNAARARLEDEDETETAAAAAS